MNGAPIVPAIIPPLLIAKLACIMAMAAGFMNGADWGLMGSDGAAAAAAAAAAACCCICIC